MRKSSSLQDRTLTTQITPKKFNPTKQDTGRMRALSQDEHQTNISFPLSSNDDLPLRKSESSNSDIKKER